MKKIIVFAAATLLAITGIQAQQETAVRKDIKELKKEKKADEKQLRKLEGNDVSVQSKTQFNIDFGNIPNVKWKRNGYFDEAVFTQHGVTKKAFYDFDSQLVGTVMPRQFSDLPTSAQKHITTKYSDYKIDRVIMYDDNEFNDMDMYLYGTQFDDEDNYFVELSKADARLILKVKMDGDVSYFKEMKN
ncbi:MAG: hypothetical protein J0I84_06720 [Terrimonas sp.]|nr:hypothetical protein [Terrimonas sp.]OJY82365.1 MAG: hypothetical protein BGP13_22055 [Sphingobacteriales bacterium 40-81]